MPTLLTIGTDAYALAEAGNGERAEFALLHRGAEALLPSTRPMDEARLEAAIETAEDWLMPHAARLRGQVLEVSDPTGRLRSGMQEALGNTTSAWSVEEMEVFFLRLVDLATGRRPAPSVADRQHFVADVLLLRELAHHGQVREIRLV